MDISQRQIELSVAVLRRPGAKKVLLFESFAKSPETAGDDDLAVEGIPLERCNGMNRWRYWFLW